MAAQLDASDAALDGFVPSLDHASFADWDAVYEPAEDTFLLLDALFAERSSLRALGDATVVEVGPGSGVVSAYVAALLAAQAPRVVCVDVNPRACALSARTAAANGARVDVVRGDLATRVRRRPSAARKAPKACPQVPRARLRRRFDIQPAVRADAAGGGRRRGHRGELGRRRPRCVRQSPRAISTAAPQAARSSTASCRTCAARSRRGAASTSSSSRRTTRTTSRASSPRTASSGPPSPRSARVRGPAPRGAPRGQ